MATDLKQVKSLKIVPENYESGTIFTIDEINETSVGINLPKISSRELEDYKTGSDIEAFGIAPQGLIYFTSKILNKNENKLTIEYPDVIKEIQRRKYSRVPFAGKMTVKSHSEAKIEPVDISAGGLKFTSDTPFMVGQEYEIKIELVNNLAAECVMQPIRVGENGDNNGLNYVISAKFKKIRSIDRIALMQYSLRLISESENKS